MSEEEDDLDLVCVCLQFKELKTPILQKAKEKLHLAQPKTQLFDKSWVLGPSKKCVQNTQYLWTAGGP